MTIRHIVDTHTLLWYFGDSLRLGVNADIVLQDPQSDLILPAIALAEACWIIQRGRVSLSIADVLAAIDKDPRISVAPLDRAVIERSNGLAVIEEMHDRQIVATALLLQDQGESVDVLTRDGNITTSGLIAAVW